MTDNAIITAVLFVATATGIPATKWLTQYVLQWLYDAEIKEIRKLYMRLIGLICGIAVAAFLYSIKMLDTPELSGYNPIVKILVVGLVFGVMAGGWRNTEQAQALVIAKAKQEVADRASRGAGEKQL